MSLDGREEAGRKKSFHDFDGESVGLVGEDGERQAFCVELSKQACW